MLTETVCEVAVSSLCSVDLDQRLLSRWKLPYRGGGQEEAEAREVDGVHARRLQRTIDALCDAVHGESCWRQVVSWPNMRCPSEGQLNGWRIHADPRAG